MVVLLTQHFYGNRLIQRPFEVSQNDVSIGCASPKKKTKQNWKDTKQTRLFVVLLFRKRFGERSSGYEEGII